MRCFFPDVNVWLALTFGGHQHHAVASRWRRSLKGPHLHFCRHTQLALLRLLTNRKIMGPGTLGEATAWLAIDEFMQDAQVSFLHEPPGLEAILRSITRTSLSSPNRWSDAYLPSFAMAADLTLVTFDRGFRSFPNLSLELLS